MNIEHEQLIWIGAGTAKLPNFDFSNFSKVCLVEANSEICKKLSNIYQSQNVYIYNRLISNSSGYTDFFVYNLEDYSSITVAKELNQLFPGIELIRKEENKEKTDILTFLDSLSITGENNVLCINVIDVCYEILEAIFDSDFICYINKIYFNYAFCEVYENIRYNDELDKLLTENNFEIIASDLSDPDLPHYTYQKSEEGKKILLLEKEIDFLKLENERQREIIAKSSYDNLISDIDRYFKETYHEIKKNTDLTVKQVEATIAIQSYLNYGLKSLNFHGWPISADLGAYLIDLIDANEFDLIIEFGSGTSTILMAKALLSKEKFRSGNINTKIVSFDHLEKYHEITKFNVVKEGLTDKAEIILAPLVETTYMEKPSYFYYDCDEELARIDKMSASPRNILVLVDGPPGNTNKYARYPAVPKLTQFLSKSSFTLLLDDFNRAEEKEVVNLWQDYLVKEGYSPSLSVIECEKGLAVLKF